MRSPNWVGDQVLAYPFFYWLRKRYPQAHITSACASWVESIQFRDLVDDVIPLDRPTDTTLSAKWRALESSAARLRDQKWDLAYALPPSFSAAWLLKRAGAQKRVGYPGDMRSLLLTRRVRRAPGVIHRAQEYVNLIEGESGWAQDFWPQLPNPEFHADAGKAGVLQHFDHKKSWPGFERFGATVKDYWVLAPGSMAESRRWSVDAFLSLTSLIHAETGWPGLIVGGPTEAPLGQQLASRAGSKLSDWTGQGAIPSFSEIFSNARFTVSNDSGLAHVASLSGSPTCVVWGAGEPKRTAPLGPGQVRLVASAPECWPCEQNTCALPGDKRLQCLKAIDPTRVWTEISRGFLSG